MMVGLSLVVVANDMYCDIFPVALSQEETIGQVPIGFLCSILSTYNLAE